MSSLNVGFTKKFMFGKHNWYWLIKSFCNPEIYFDKRLISLLCIPILIMVNFGWFMSSIQQHPQLLNFLIFRREHSLAEWDGWLNGRHYFFDGKRARVALYWKRLSEHYKVCCSLDFHSAVKEQASPACSFILFANRFKIVYLFYRDIHQIAVVFSNVEHRTIIKQ